MDAVGVVGEPAGRAGGVERPPRVLVVEDDSEVSNLLAEVLSDAGYSVTAVASGRSAIARATDADLVVIDIGLPDVNGIEVCRTLRATPDVARLPIVLLTALDTSHARVEGIESGADDYVVKPFDVDELMARIRSLLRTRRIEAALRERTRALDTLRQLTTTLVNTIAVEELGQRIADAVPSAFGRDSGFVGGAICTVDQDVRRIRWLAMTSRPAMQRVHQILGRTIQEVCDSFDPPVNLLHEVAGTGEPRESDCLADLVAPGIPKSAAEAIESLFGLRGVIAYPIKLQGKTIGVFVFALSKSVAAVTAAERELIADFSTTAGIALENVRLYTMAERLMLTDPLTGIANRRQFDRSLIEEIARASRHGYPLALLLIDIDHFKVYNDAYGHQAGDAALRLVAESLRRSIRSTDLVARYGGEEFVVLLPNTTASGARTVAEKARRAVADQAGLGLTISIGGTSQATPNGDRLLKAADSALYTAKNSGRNCTVIAPEP